MIVDKKAKVSTGGKQVSECIIPLFPESVEDVVKVFKSTPDIALKCLQNGLTIEYQRVERNKFVIRTSKPSKQKTELIAKTKAQGYYKEEYETMNVRSIMLDVLASIPTQ